MEYFLDTGGRRKCEQVSPMTVNRQALGSLRAGAESFL